MKDCNVEGLFKFPGMIVFDGDVRMWAGTTYDGLDRYIERHLGIDPDLMGYRIYKDGELIETIGDYVKRKK